ncbi:MAG: HEPN domain-containing protein [Chloroflexi bacterium]|nr:HEPN domain-containing protein [Chloroflexota bacterium]
MKNAELQALIAYRLQRADETLVEARLMQSEGHWNACANRLYYATFYAVSALLVKDGYAAAKHSGLKAMFNQHYVKPGLITKENGRLYNRLFDVRQEGDYLDFVSLDAETVEPLVEEMAEFIDDLKTLIAQSTATEF